MAAETRTTLPRSGPTGKPMDRLDRGLAAYEQAAKPVLILVFIIAAVLPIYFFAGPLRLSFLRLFLLIMFVPLLFRWLSGKYGGIIFPDIALIFLIFWMFVSLTFNHGLTRSVEFFAIQIVELLGSYLLARVYIRDKASFVYFIRVLLWVILFILPFAIYESLSRSMLISQVLGAIPGLSVHPNVFYESRLGLFRAQATFEHPILFGVFCSTGFAMAWFGLQVERMGPAKRLFWAMTAGLGAFFSISSGALLAIVTQIGLIVWNAVMGFMRKHWRLLIIIIAVFYVVIDLLSNRTPITVFISFATFNSGTAYWRVLIWEFGSAEVWRHPIFGLGLHDWLRPAWMHSSSVDNFWLVMAMRYGLPGFFAVTASFLTILIRVSRMDFSHDPDLAACQKAYVITVICLFGSICTVHIWGAVFVYAVFLVASGAWMFTSDLGADADQAEAAGGARSRGKTRGENRGENRDRPGTGRAPRRGGAGSDLNADLGADLDADLGAGTALEDPAPKRFYSPRDPNHGKPGARSARRKPRPRR